MPEFGFTREERLKKRKLIDALFLEGESHVVFPLRILWTPHPEGAKGPHQVVIAVSKRSFRKAIDRNLLRRRIRESYRQNKQFLAEVPRQCLGFIFIGRELSSYAEIEEKVRKAIRRVGLARS